jgi:hypothetical protein
VKWLYKAYANRRRGLAEIASELESRGIVRKKRGGANAGKPMTPQGVACVLRNPAYVGDTAWNKRSVGKYSRLVDGKAQPEPRRGANPESEWFVVQNSHRYFVDQAQMNE